MTDTLHELTWAAAAAAALGLLMLRFRQPPALGFLLAGLALGPTGVGLFAYDGTVRLFTELAVLLLLFVGGLQISVRGVRDVLRPAGVSAFAQVAAAVGVTVLVSALLGWSLSQALIVGFALSLSSAAQGLEILESVGQARREPGRLAVGGLVAQGVLAVPMLLAAAALGTPHAPAAGTATHTEGLALFLRLVVGVGLVAGLIALASRPGRLTLPFAVAPTGGGVSGPLTAIAVCALGAAAAGLLGLSPVYGALPAGLVIGATKLRAKALRHALPIQTILVLLFFLCVGLMLDLRTLLPVLPLIVVLAAAVLAVRTFAAAVALRLLHAPPRESLVAAAALAPSGELGFLVAAVGLVSGALDADGYQTALAVIALSMAASPLWALAARRAVAHPETDAATVRAFFGEIFEHEIAAVRRWLARAGEAASRWLARAEAAVRAVVKRAAPTVAGAWRSARDAVRRPPRPANDYGAGEPPPGGPSKDEGDPRTGSGPGR